MEQTERREARKAALTERYQYEINYFAGVEVDTPAAKKYGDEMERIKRAFCAARKAQIAASQPSDPAAFYPTLAVAAAGLIGWLITGVVPVSGEVIGFLFIALCVALHFTTHNTYFSLVPFFVVFIAAFFELGRPAVLIQILAAAGYALLSAFQAKRNGEKAAENVAASRNRVAALQSEMTALLPQMRQELMAHQKQWYEKHQDVLTPEDCRDYLGQDFPGIFWWQIPLADQEKFREQFSCQRYGSWETKPVPRKAGQEFEAVDEYTPLFEMRKDLTGKFSDIYPPSKGYEIVDLISRLTILTTRESTIQYEVPAHDDLEQFAATMNVMSVAHDVDKAYADGKIDSVQHTVLGNKVMDLARENAQRFEETRVETSMEIIPIHNHANFWTGQLVLGPIQTSKGTERALVHYTCQVPHMLENLKAMEGMQIAKVYADYWTCNPYFMAEFFSYFPDTY